MIRIGIVGAKGYAAGEAMRWIAVHPEFELCCLMARIDAPEPVEKYHADLRGIVTIPVEPVDNQKLAETCDAVILGLPHTASAAYAAPLLAAGLKVIDLSADFRFDSVALFEATYNVTHPSPELSENFVYALPELFGDAIPAARALACPGCYPTAALLGIAPIASRAEDFDLEHIVMNALSGVSGAGRKVAEDYMFVEANESVKAYGIASHRHRPEIEEKLAKLTGSELKVTFTPHLIPMNRGELVTTTVPLKKTIATREALGLFEEFYGDKPFVRVLPEGEAPTTGAVRGSNFCDIGVAVDGNSGVLIVVSAIDNLAKGTASQAVQAMNLMYGFPETLGLLPGADSAVPQAS